METEYSVLEAARMLGKSKNTLKYQVQKLPPECIRKDDTGMIRITAAGVEMLRQRLTVQPGENQTKNQYKPPSTGQKLDKNHLQPDEQPDEIGAQPVEKPPIQPPTTTAEAQLIEAYRQQITDQREQLTAKDRQIERLTEQLAAVTAALENTTAALTAAQALHAGTMQQHTLIETAVPAEPTAEQPDEPPKKRGVFSRIFGGKQS